MAASIRELDDLDDWEKEWENFEVGLEKLKVSFSRYFLSHNLITYLQIAHTEITMKNLRKEDFIV